MRAARAKRPRRSPSKPDAGEASRWNARRRIDALETENNTLRQALREIITWYDTFDQPGGTQLSDDDFNRLRTLARFGLTDAHRRVL